MAGYIDRSDLVGPPAYPSTGFYPDEYWRIGPSGGEDNTGVYSVDTGWDTTTVKSYPLPDDEG